MAETLGLLNPEGQVSPSPGRKSVGTLESPHYGCYRARSSAALRTAHQPAAKGPSPLHSSAHSLTRGCMCDWISLVTDAYGVEAPGADPGTSARVKAFAASLMRTLPRVTRALRVPTPRQTLDQHLNGTLGTFCFHSSLPHLVCVLFLLALGHRAPPLPRQWKPGGLDQPYVRGWDTPGIAHGEFRGLTFRVTASHSRKLPPSLLSPPYPRRKERKTL